MAAMAGAIGFQLGLRMSGIGATPSRLDTLANVSSLNLLRTLPGR